MTISEILLYCGVVVIVLTVFLAIICFIYFGLSGKHLKAKLEEEYGQPQRYHVEEKKKQ